MKSTFLYDGNKSEDPAQIRFPRLQKHLAKRSGNDCWRNIPWGRGPLHEVTLEQ